MQTKTTYKGTIDDIYGIYCGFKPKGLKNVEEVIVYYPDEGKVFVKDDKEYTAVVLKENENINDYEEIEKESEDDNKYTNR